MDMDASQQVKTTWERILTLLVAPRCKGRGQEKPLPSLISSNQVQPPSNPTSNLD